jgi:plastocyanin
MRRKKLRMFSAPRVVRMGLLVVALVGCGEASSARRASSAGELVQLGPVTYANWGSRDARRELALQLDAGDFYFKGTFLRGDPGRTLTLAIDNVGGQVHNISIPAQGLDRDLPSSGPRVNVEVTFPMTGEVQFFCKYHTARGMNGLLVVGDLPLLSAASPSPAPSP